MKNVKLPRVMLEVQEIMNLLLELHCLLNLLPEGKIQLLQYHKMTRI